MATSTLKEHLQRHEQVLDIDLNDLKNTVWGENRANGLCKDVSTIKEGYAQMKTIGIAILITLIGNIILGIIK